ncbi:hypothetical protein [Parasphingorhabdus sp.]|uniref:hypothetical protein n=1 Tax=Parasphingorhabdus sp. TaxID=2709688 RepID=UPI0032656F40
MKVLVFFLVIILASTPAWACMAEPVPQAMMYKTKPSDSSPGTMVIKAKIIEKLPKSWTVRVRVLEGPSELEQTAILVSPAFFSSCTTFGRDIGYLAIKLDAESQEPSKFVADVFERSWLDWVVDLFGGDPYYFSSDKVLPQILSLSND